MNNEARVFLFDHSTLHREVTHAFDGSSDRGSSDRGDGSRALRCAIPGGPIYVHCRS
jgi:hypothetical protein